MSTRLRDQLLQDQGSDPVSPTHYQQGGVQIIDVLEAYGFAKGFCAGNVIKYVARYRKKNGVEDLRKAAWYLERLIEMETEEAK